jgi:flagellar hook assembly protein FlgD
LRVPFALPRDAMVHLDVLDLQGRIVATLVDGTLSSGQHEVTWSGVVKGGKSRSGVYFIRLQVSGRSFVKRVIVTR